MRQAIATVIMWLAYLLPGPAVADDPPHIRCVKVFDALGYSYKPDLSRIGLEPVFVFDALRWWRADEPRHEMTAARNLEKWVFERRKDSRQLVLDIEEWPVRGEPAVVEASVTRLIAVLRRVRDAGYAGPIGYYGLAPIRDYWRSVRPADSSEYRQWAAENDRLQPLADNVDALFPSLYTFYDDIAGWEAYALANLREARRLAKDKPVYPFLWPQFHESNQKLAGQYLPAAAWRRQLEFVQQHADGMVLWGGWAGNGPARWDEDAAWWQATREFLRESVAAFKRGAGSVACAS